MYEISLLPRRYKQERAGSVKSNNIITSFIFSILILSVLGIFVLSVKLVINNELNTIRDSNAALMTEINALGKYSGLESKIKAVYDSIQTLSDGVPSFPQVISELSESAPSSVELTAMTVTYSPKTKTSVCKIDGIALDYADVAAWMSSLGQFKDVGEIYCSYTSQKKSNSMNQIVFELKMDILNADAFDDVVW